MKVVIVLITIVAITSGQNELNQAGQQFGAAFKSIGDYFIKQYHTLQDLFANSKQELEKKVQDTDNFLNQLKANMDSLMADANRKGDTELRNALSKVNAFAQDVNDFQSRLKIVVQQDTTQLQTEWKQKATEMYNGGLDKIIKAAEAAKGGSSALQKNMFLISTTVVVVIAKLL